MTVNSLYDFFNPAGSDNQIIEIGISWQYWMIVLISVFSLSLLFIFKRAYLYTLKLSFFRIALGYFQIFLYIFYYFLHFLYLYGFKDQNLELRGWPWILPFHLSSITQIFSGILLIKPNNKLFSISAPWVVFMVTASIFIPATKSAGPEHFAFWSYYILHIIILFTYWSLYMYGLVKYERRMFGWSFISLTIFSLVALSINAISLKIAKSPHEITNFLFIGREGYPLWGDITTSNIWNHENLWPLGFFFLYAFGISLLFISHLMLVKVKPFYYKNKDNKFVVLESEKEKWDFITFKIMFLYVKEDINSLKNKIRKRYEAKLFKI